MRNGLRTSISMISPGCALNSRAQEPAGAYTGARFGEATNEADEFKGSDPARAFNQYFGVEPAFIDAGSLLSFMGADSGVNTKSWT